MVDKLGKDSALREIGFTETVLEEDPKNYHAWSHRQVFLSVILGSTSYIFNAELELCSDKVQFVGVVLFCFWLEIESSENHVYFKISFSLSCSLCLWM